MRKTMTLFACALVSAVAFASPVLADGGKDQGAFVARQPSGPTDSKLFGKESAPSGDAASNSAPPTAPAPMEEAAPIAPVQTQELAAPQSQPSGPPFWNNRWFWALIAILLLLTAGAVEYFGRKNDERLAADEPDDAPLKA